MSDNIRDELRTPNFDWRAQSSVAIRNTVEIDANPFILFDVSDDSMTAEVPTYNKSRNSQIVSLSGEAV